MALVITIIIIIILSTVAINFAFGDNGLITQAERARDMASNATVLEQETMNSMASELEKLIPFEPQPTPEPPTSGTAMSNMTNGIIEIKWLSGTSNYVSETPNAPVIKKDLPDGTTMEQVVFDEENQTWVAGTEYSYEPGTGSSDNTSSKWANARVTIDGIDSYFVWIPRYAYRIIYFNSAESKQEYQEGTLTEEQAKTQGKIIGYSDSRGIVDAEGRKIESVTSTTKTMVSEDYFMTHPAFTNEEENGGWSSELAGIWIGKYEASLVNKTDGSNIVTAVSNGNILLSNNADKAVVTKPGYSSWRWITIGNMYDNARYYSTDLKSHMLKNSEWGVVAYLTESKYGRNGIEIGFSDEGYITGGGEGHSYATTNQDQSTTGNVYGIYDLSGGANEYVASYYNGSSSLSNGSSFASNGGISDKYSTTYIGTEKSTSYKYGDATYETSGWHSANAGFASTFFVRGGIRASTGLFYCGGATGNVASTNSFRLALCVE